MREMIVNELTQAMQELVRNVAHFLPRLMVMLIFVLLGWLIAYVVKRVLRSILYFVSFDRFSENTGDSTTSYQGGFAVLDGTAQPVRLLGDLAGICPAGDQFAGIVGASGAHRQILSVPAADCLWPCCSFSSGCWRRTSFRGQHCYGQ